MRGLSGLILSVAFLAPAQAQVVVGPYDRHALPQQQMTAPPSHRPAPPAYVDGMNTDRKPLPQGRGQALVARGSGGAGDQARATTKPFAPSSPQGEETPYYWIPNGATREQVYDLSPGRGPQQGYYESSQGYYATPDFSAPEPRSE